MKTVMVSGGFDPVHFGHIRMFEDAKSIGDRLIVAINSDEWLKRKKGYCFMPWEIRSEIVKSIRHVDEVVSVDDSDGTVMDAIIKVNPDIFANGGDRTLDNTPEIEVCNRMGIDLAWGGRRWKNRVK